MVQKITTKKPYLIEGKLVKAGSSIHIIENADMENYPVPDVSANASMPDSTDIEMMRRIRRAKARKMAGAKATKRVRHITLDDADNSFPADEIQALRKSRRIRSVDGEEISAIRNSRRARRVADDMMEDDDEIMAMRRARAMRMRRAKKAEGEDASEEDKVEERRKALRRIRQMKRIRALKRAEAEGEDTATDEVSEKVKAMRAMRRARMTKRAEDEVTEGCKKAEDDGIDEDAKMEEMLKLSK